MEKGKTRFLVPLVALCVLLTAGSPAFAQITAITYQITSTPTFVINTGRSEVLGNVRITAQNDSGPAVAPNLGDTQATTAEFLYENTGCDNDTTNGIGIIAIEFAAGGFVTGNVSGPAAPAISSVTNQAAGCVVAVTIPVGLLVNGTLFPRDFIEVQGVRGRVDLSPAGAPSVGVDIRARLNATPSGSALFTAPSIVRVATSAVGLLAAITNGVVLFCTGPPPVPLPVVTVQEGFNGAFVQHVVSAGGTPVPLDFRPATGVCIAAAPFSQGCGLNNTQIRIAVEDIPAGVTLAFPAGPIIGTNLTTVTPSAGQLELISSTVTGTTQVVIYDFATTSQATSDINTEIFAITPMITLPATLVLGVATAQVRLWPGLMTSFNGGDALSVTDPPFSPISPAGAVIAAAPKPRFNDPPIPTPAGNFLTVNPCNTYLLFPFVVNQAGFDTGLAIANTTMDASAFAGLPNPTLMQDGTCTLWGWAAADGAEVAYTTPSVATGTTWLSSLSSANNPALNGFIGYIIACCNFQFAHGFAFVTDGFGAPTVTHAQGYLALIIPNPFITLGARGANTAGFAPGGPFAQDGEGLGQ